MGSSPVFFFLSFVFRQLTRRDAPPCVCLPLSLFDLIAVPLSLLLHFIPLCGTLVILVLALSSYLGCLALLIWLPFLPYAYYMWLPWFISPLFLGFFPPESLPGDDVLSRLLSRPLPSVYFLPCLFVLFCFVFSDRVHSRFVLV